MSHGQPAVRSIFCLRSADLSQPRYCICPVIILYTPGGRARVSLWQERILGCRHPHPGTKGWRHVAVAKPLPGCTNTLCLQGQHTSWPQPAFQTGFCSQTWCLCSLPPTVLASQALPTHPCIPSQPQTKVQGAVDVSQVTR